MSLYQSLKQNLRARFRSWYLETLHRALLTDEGRTITSQALTGLLTSRPQDLEAGRIAEQPYRDLGHAALSTSTAHRDDVIMISARFRSGSTLLWNIFRRLPDCHAYYEPFNERRWFNPQVRGNKVDTTHREVDAYWTEYEGLEFLNDIFDDNWHRRDFYMSADAWNPSMQLYVDQLIQHAHGRPVLQFNRLDLRLPWARKTWPNARFIHLYRHPRDQWLSVLVRPEDCPKDANMAGLLGHDRFYTQLWADDLKHHFPFLDSARCEHPYQLHYYLWKLSYAYGRAYSHCSIGFEELTNCPERVLTELFTLCGVDLKHVENILPIIQPPPFGKWRNYADDEWFLRHETHCENVMAEFFQTVPRDVGGCEVVREGSAVICPV